MRLITSDTEINQIVAEAVDQFQRHYQDGQFVATDAECSTPFWRETMYDLVQLAISAYPIATKYERALTKHHKRHQTHLLPLWGQLELDFEAIITRGLTSSTPVEFGLLALSPLVVFNFHCCLYEQFEEPIEEALFLPAQEWLNAIAIAEYYLLLGEPVSSVQKNHDTWDMIVGRDLF